MSVTIDIDIGGTFTDAFVRHELRTAKAKAPTTPHNLAVGFKEAVAGAAAELGLPADNLVREADVIRYSTTVAMNALIQRLGPKLGFITTAGHESMLVIGRARQWADGLAVTERRHLYRANKPEQLIPIDMVAGIRERVDAQGNELVGIDPDEVREKIQQLVDRGARGFVVCFLWSFLNGDHERQVREIFEREYPDSYLGNMPMLLSHEVQPKWHEYPRANMAILSAYLRSELGDQLSDLGDDMRAIGYDRPMHIINNTGGVAKLSRTRPVDTYGAGPVAGLFGSAHFARLYGLDRVLATDMGGTSFDFGVIEDGLPSAYQSWPVVDRWATESSMVEVSTIGAGGGSIAWINPHYGNRLEVGPQSAGSRPGPACYGRGGEAATVTDADLVLGYLSPTGFVGGSLQLDVERARAAIAPIAESIGCSIEEAAAAIREVVGENMAAVIAKELALKGHDPADFTLFAYGGAGPMHCCDYARTLGTDRIYVFPQSSVFCALGGATMDLRHVYESSRHIALSDQDDRLAGDDELATFNQVVAELEEHAVRDIRGEGFPREAIQWSLELDMRYGMQPTMLRVRSPAVRLSGAADVQALIEEFHRQFVATYGELAATAEKGVNVESFYLTATVELEKPPVDRQPVGADDPEGALIERRPVYWPDLGRHEETPVYALDRLARGNRVSGPGVVAAPDTTVVVPPEWEFTVDEYANGVLTRKGK